MYVAKLSYENIFYRVTIFEKTWSEEMLSNSMLELDNKRFMSYFFAKYWLNKKLVDILIQDKQVEIVDG